MFILMNLFFLSGIPSIEEQQELQKEEAERVRTRVEQLGK
jgi:hypothetical protein